MIGLGEHPGFLLLRAGGEKGGERLDVFLARKFARSRRAIRSRLKGGVWGLDGRPLKWSHRLRPGETIRVRKLVHPEPEVEVGFGLLYLDEWMVAVDKAAGAPVHPTRSFRTRTLLTHLMEQLGRPTLKPGHRLDRETSGVVVFGCTDQATASLAKQFKEGQVKKRYLAVVRGEPGFDRITVEEPLGRDPEFPVRCRMRVDRQSGRKAATDLEVLSRRGDRSLVCAVPRTGRQHQIRVHLAWLGHPVLGDKLYQEEGRPYLALIRDALDRETLSRLGHVRQALHAERLDLAHPATGAALRIQAPLPEDLRRLLN